MSESDNTLRGFELEEIVFPEQKTNSNLRLDKPAVLVHAAGLDHQFWMLPNRQGRLHVEAASKLYRQEEVSKIVYTGGEYRKGKRPMADAMRSETLRYLNDVDPDDIISIPKAVTTRAEIRVFKEEATRRGWDNLLDISIKSQLGRIRRRLLAEFGREIPTRSVEEILGILDMENADAVSRRESLLTVLDATPLVGTVMDLVAHRIPSKCYLEELLTELLG